MAETAEDTKKGLLVLAVGAGLLSNGLQVVTSFLIPPVSRPLNG
jgi:hypothetical protein